MPRENSFTDSEGRSLTPDLEEEEEFERRLSSTVPAASPTYSVVPPSAGLPHVPLTRIKSPARSERTNGGGHFENALSHWAKSSPKERFRTAVRKVISMHRGTSFLALGRRIGAEPGVDPRRASADIQYGHIQQQCAIEITDYSSIRASVQRMTNKEFIDLMEDDEASQRPPWVRVRWINIGGMSWDVIKSLSLKYNLHPLALEDVFHGNNQNRSKADYYAKHLFLRVLCHQLGDMEADDSNTFIPDVPRSSSPEPLEDELLDEKASRKDTPDIAQPKISRRKRRRPILPFHNHDIGKELSAQPNLARLMGEEGTMRNPYTRPVTQQAMVDDLKQEGRVKVDVSSMFFFLFRDGTVISIHPKPNLDFTAPITQRLRQPDTVLRQSADPSLLVHALLDLIVDRALQVVDAYHGKITRFERDILLKPQVKTIRYLHILSGDLILHKRTLEPIKTLVYGLRRYDADRCAALIDSSDPANANVQVVGFMSHKSKIYLADVFDHMEYILTSLDMFAGIAENLIDYSFNCASYEMNVVMRRLTLVTIVGLPLTLLTGYFGMNFDRMSSVQLHSELFFWIIAIPLFAVVTILVMYQELAETCYYIYKKITGKAVHPKIKNH